MKTTKVIEVAAAERAFADKAAAAREAEAQLRDVDAELEQQRKRVAALRTKVDAAAQELQHVHADAPEFGQLVDGRAGDVDRLMALERQLEQAETARADEARDVERARAAAAQAGHVLAEARIRAHSAELSKLLVKHVDELLPHVQEHWRLVLEENRARGTHNPGAAWPAAEGEPFTVWGEGAPDPTTAGFWNMLAKAYVEHQAAPAAEEEGRADAA